MDGSNKMALRMDASKDPTGGIILRNSKPPPNEYRIEYKLIKLDFGGKHNGKINTDGEMNGYTPGASSNTDFACDFLSTNHSCTNLHNIKWFSRTMWLFIFT